MTAREHLDWSGVRAAIIDLDGTLLDTAGDFHAAVNRMRADFGLPPLALDTIVGFVGKGSENLIRQVLAQGLDTDTAEHQFDAALACYQRHYAAINGSHVALYPEVISGLAALRAHGLRLACVTNKPFGFALALLRQTDLLGYFEVVYGGDSLPTRKPDPGPLLQVCADFGLTPEQVVAIGDSSNDALAARGAGCRVLNVPYGYNHGQPIQDVDSDGIVPTLLHAAQLISA